MPDRTTISVSKVSAEEFHEARERNGMEKSAFLLLAVRALEHISPETRIAIQLSLRDARDPHGKATPTDSVRRQRGPVTGRARSPRRTQAAA